MSSKTSRRSKPSRTTKKPAKKPAAARKPAPRKKPAPKKPAKRVRSGAPAAVKLAAPVVGLNDAIDKHGFRALSYMDPRYSSKTRFVDMNGKLHRYNRSPRAAITARFSAGSLAHIDEVSKQQGDIGRSKALELIVRLAAQA